MSEDTLDAARARAHAREQVFALLSHEIRTPLNGVIGMAGLLAATPLDTTQSAYLTSLQDCADHLLGLVNDVLDLAKLESDRIELEPTPTDVEALLQGVCELLSPRAHAAGLDIGAWTGGDMPVLLADDGRLRQILFNLAGNAVKLTRAGGVELGAERVGPVEADGRVRVRFSVTDTGPGLAETDRQRIFEAFVQAQAGVQAGGAGLGLAIVRRLAHAFGGEVSVDSRLGEGARFSFEALFETAGAARVGGDLKNVSVRLDTPSPIVRSVAGALVRAAGGRIAEPGASCDVALIDMPEPSEAPPRDAPALALLTPEARERIEPLRSAGWAGYLIKPLRRSSLVDRIRAATASAAHTPGPSPDERAQTRGPAGAGLRVLLAEDNPVNALLAQTLLTRAGCRVDRAAEGGEAVAAALARPYDLILMDMRMPGMDGLTAARTLRQSGCRTPVVALTANAFDDDRRACRDAGMDGFLAKPLDPAALEAVLTQATAGATSSPSRA